MRLSSRRIPRWLDSQRPSRLASHTTTAAISNSGTSATVRTTRSLAMTQVSARRALKLVCSVSWLSTATTPSMAPTILAASWRASLSGTWPVSCATPACTVGWTPAKAGLRDSRAVMSASMRSSSCCVARVARCTSLASAGGGAASDAGDATALAARDLMAVSSSAAPSCACAGAAASRPVSDRAKKKRRASAPGAAEVKNVGTENRIAQ